MSTPTAVEQSTPHRKNMIALLPFAIFLGLFLGTGIILTLQGSAFAFYQLPASIAIIPAIFVALYLGKVLGK